MAYMKHVKSEEEIKKLTVGKVRQEYNSLADGYTRLLDLDIIYCHGCNDFIHKSKFYKAYNGNASGYYHYCKRCTHKKATDYDKKTDTYKDNREKTIEVLRDMNLPFVDSLYNSMLATLETDVGLRETSDAWSRYIATVSSLPQYTKMTFKDSDFGSVKTDDDYEDEESQRIIQAGRKRFGSYPKEDLYFLEIEYEDWITRYPCDNKSQELLFQRICFKQLEIDHAQKHGKDTKELDKSLQDILGSLGIKPVQSNADALSDTLSLDQLIDKWESEKPIPEPEGEFKDVDRIGMLIDVFFKGHLSLMMGLKNGFSALYEKFIAKYTVNKPQYDENEDSETLFNKIFGREVIEDDIHE